MVYTIPQQETHRISAGENRIVDIDCTKSLRGSELLVSVTDVEEITTSDLTFTDEQINTTVLVIKKKQVAIGRAVLFRVLGQQAGTTYRIRITSTSDSTPAQKRVFDVLLECVA